MSVRRVEEYPCDVLVVETDVDDGLTTPSMAFGTPVDVPLNEDVPPGSNCAADLVPGETAKPCSINTRTIF